MVSKVTIATLATNVVRPGKYGLKDGESVVWVPEASLMRFIASSKTKRFVCEWSLTDALVHGIRVRPGYHDNVDVGVIWGAKLEGNALVANVEFTASTAPAPENFRFTPQVLFDAKGRFANLAGFKVVCNHKAYI